MQCEFVRELACTVQCESSTAQLFLGASTIAEVFVASALDRNFAERRPPRRVCSSPSASTNFDKLVGPRIADDS
ncbi:hypothetical protein [Haloferax sp. ATB1]|uniref:hypothetical protein n=1 Tax=Haloferax sp. ATB1 TaxID=1508454 RepID=UPI000A6872E6|nr:hypothetical protein [Haloferax sp. ATB1]